MLPAAVSSVSVWGTGTARCSTHAVRKGRLLSTRVQEEAVAPVRLCVVGGGLAGLASAYYAVKRFPAVDITVYDTHKAPGVGQGASTAPVTLLHPFTPKGKVIWKGLEGFQSMLDIMSDTNYSAGMMPGADDMRIIRPFFSSKKFSDYKRIMDKNPHHSVVLDDSECKLLIPSLSLTTEDFVGGVKLEMSRVIDTPHYLRGLWHYIQFNARKSTWTTKTVTDLKKVKEEGNFDAVIISAGSGSQKVWEKSGGIKLPMQYVQGQTIVVHDPLHPMIKDEASEKFSPTTKVCEDSSELKWLSHAVISGEYVIPHPTQPGYLLIGATKENSTAPLRDQCHDISVIGEDRRINVLLEKAKKLYPPLEFTHSVNINLSGEHKWSGCRVVVNRLDGGPRLPLVLPHSIIDDCWFMAGFGSRGLIHHAVVAKYLIEAIATGDPTCIPTELGLRSMR